MPLSPKQKNLLSYRASDVKWHLGYDYWDIMREMEADTSVHQIDLNELVGYVMFLNKRVGTECTEIEFAQNKEKLKDLLNRYKERKTYSENN